ncbi:ATP-binding protein [Spirulina major CS-329]|uniref:cache domain-containing sensor histidine kinase n=1 Tax=Spirulina TaxID=1154 RepID=UPI00232CAEF8|nr:MULTISPECIES: ATP-binding protein [Spirulina]MDB9493820.1 ATP-binding protein [Spirulina subsalsa CS-330]MDB9505402.1 ATP-binding protein [Spirulina major CS-329]
MLQPSPSSFRRLLLIRLLFLTVPAFVIGVMITYGMTYRQARTAMRQAVGNHLTASADRYSNDIEYEITQVNRELTLVRQSFAALSSTSSDVQASLTTISQSLHPTLDCLQLQDLQTRTVLASTCHQERIAPPAALSWPVFATPSPEHPDPLMAPLPPLPNREPNFSVALALPMEAIAANPPASNLALVARATFTHSLADHANAFAGYPVIIDDTGTIVLHRSSAPQNQSIAQLSDDDRKTIQKILDQSRVGDRGAIELVDFGNNGAKSIAGYKVIANPLIGNTRERWVVLAIAPLANTLKPIRQIHHTLLTGLILLTVTMMGLTVGAILIIARDMARPVEQLRDYVLQEEQLYINERIPKNFQIEEFNQLAGAINNMIRRLISWAEELEGAWKEAQLANQLKSEFLSTVSHNLRTPLNGIIGSLQILQDGYCDTDAEEQEFLEKARQSTLTLKGIIDDILDLSQLEKGQLDVEIERVPLMTVLEDAIALETMSLGEKGLLLDIQVWPDDILIYADPVKLRQVFLSILDNAIKFTPAGHISIKTAIAMHSGVQGSESPLPPLLQNLHSSSGQWAVVSIQDTGVGIAPEQQKKLFRPFVLMNPQVNGAGLGLAIARNLLELMGGAIELTSAGVNQGTTVTLYLPTAQRQR